MNRAIFLQEADGIMEAGVWQPLTRRSYSWQDNGNQEPLDLSVWSHSEDRKDLSVWWDLNYRSEALDLTIKSPITSPTRCESSGTGTLSSSSSDTGQVTDSETDGAAIHNGSIPKKEPKIIHVCQVCNKKYKQTRGFRAHMATHKSLKEFQCDMCSQVLDSLRSYLQHLKEHGRVDLCYCEQCDKYFRDNCTLEAHMMTHTGDKPFKCTSCTRTFRQAGTLTRHLRRHEKVHSHTL